MLFSTAGALRLAKRLWPCFKLCHTLSLCSLPPFQLHLSNHYFRFPLTLIRRANFSLETVAALKDLSAQILLKAFLTSKALSFRSCWLQSCAVIVNTVNTCSGDETIATSCTHTLSCVLTHPLLTEMQAYHVFLNVEKWRRFWRPSKPYFLLLCPNIGFKSLIELT